MEFEYSFFIIFGIILIPILVVFWILSDNLKAKRLFVLGNPNLLKTSSFSLPGWFIIMKRTFLLLALFLFFIALMGPRILEKTIKQKNLSLDMVIALDCSASMLARDLKPNRMERAKMEISALLDSLKGDRVALVVFSGDAFLQCPLTIDYSALKMFLNTVNTDFLPTPGTDIARAIQTALKAFPKESDYKVILLITDGETEDKRAAMDAARKARAEGVKIYTIGIGSETGEPIPLENGGYKRDSNGQVIMTKLDSRLLMQIASETGGRYFNAMNGALGIKSVFEVISGEKRRYVESSFLPQYKYMYVFPLFFGFLLLFVGWFFPYKSRWLI